MVIAYYVDGKVGSTEMMPYGVTTRVLILMDETTPVEGSLLSQEFMPLLRCPRCPAHSTQTDAQRRNTQTNN